MLGIDRKILDEVYDRAEQMFLNHPSYNKVKEELLSKLVEVDTDDLIMSEGEAFLPDGTTSMAETFDLDAREYLWHLKLGKYHVLKFNYTSSSFDGARKSFMLYDGCNYDIFNINIDLLMKRAEFIEGIAKFGIVDKSNAEELIDVINKSEEWEEAKIYLLNRKEDADRVRDIIDQYNSAVEKMDSLESEMKEAGII